MIPEDLRSQELQLWRKELGLMPVPLFASHNQDSYVLLNGVRGNFCLDLGHIAEGDQGRSYAWSSNVGHYVKVTNDQVEVQKWDQSPYTVERYRRKSVYDNLERFHAYLEKDFPRPELSIVSHAIRVFRSLRALLGSDFDGFQALKGFLYLLASVTDNVERGQLNLNTWRLDLKASGVINSLKSGDWSALREELIQGRSIEHLVPNFSLLLRHAAGQLFQEAHYEAIFVPQRQLTFEGFLPSPVDVKKSTDIAGVYFTPSALARTLVEECLLELDLGRQSVTVFDPACGSGEFLLEVIRQLRLRNFDGHIKVIGWDVSAAACDMANFILAWETRDIEEQVTIEIRCVDSLAHDHSWPRDVDLVLMNPPFLSWQGMGRLQQAAIKSVLGSLAEKRPDLSYAFLWKAVQSVREEGVLGCFIPASFLSGESAVKLRQEIGGLMSPRIIARLGSHLLFSNALVDTAFYVAVRDAGSDRVPVAFWADHQIDSTSNGLRTLRKIRYLSGPGALPAITPGFSIYRSPNIGRTSSSWAPRPYSSQQMLHSLRHLPTVGDLFKVRQGTITGLNKAFVLDKEVWLKLPKSERIYFRPAVVNKSISYGYLNDSNYVFYPYGENHIEDEVELRRALKHYFAEYLLPAKEKLISRSRIRSDRWWELSRNWSWQVTREPKLVSTYFGDAGSFAWDSSGDYVVVQGYAWLPKITSSKFSPLPPVLGLAYLAILNSSVFSELLSAVSNNVGGGQWNLSARFVRNISLPDLFDESTDPSVVSELADFGRQIQEGLPIEQEEKYHELIRLVYRINETV